MQSITVIKDDLITTLRQNRDAHRSMFLKAQEVYRDKMIEEMERALKEAREGGAIERSFRLPLPEDHTDDFDTAIEMLEWEQADQIMLSQQDFLTFVRNQWGWRQSFAANTGSYLAE